MPVIEIRSSEQYKKAFDVLIRTGGTFQGLGREKRILLVTDAQYRALVAARVVKPTLAKARGRGQKKTNRNGEVEGTAEGSEN